MNDYKFWIAIYGAVVGTASLGWRFYEFYYDRKGRLKIIHAFHTNFLIGNNMFTTIFDFTIVNLRAKKIIIRSIGYQLNKPDDTIYSPLERYVSGKLTPLELGETFNYEVRYNDFNNLFEDTEATKFRLVVEDTTGKAHKTKWIKILKVPTSTGHISEMKLNDNAISFNFRNG